VTHNAPCGANILTKMLSHRLRGFGKFENAGAALRGACASEVPWLELDTRVSTDGSVFVYHNASVHIPGTLSLPFATTPASALNAIRYPDGEPLLSLQNALESFAARTNPGQKLCIDIKDSGFEATHLQLVRDAGVEQRVCFVSWIPQTILRLHELGTSASLILSYCSMLDLGPVGRILDRGLARRRLRIGRFAVLGKQTTETPLRSLSHGFQHVLCCRHLPLPLLAALRASEGGVCVHRRFVGPHLSRYCRDAGLQLWTFSVRTTPEFIRYASRPDIDVVFCDDAPGIWRDMTEPH
jgi:glycerophosphoryl diester phosphodiesterase